MRQAASNAAREIEDKELEVPHGVLDVVAEHPKEQHVGEQVQDVAVQELVGDQRRAFGNLVGLIGRQHRRRPDRGRGTVRIGMRAKLAIAACPQAYLRAAKTTHVGGDQPDGDPLEANGAQGIVVRQGNENHVRIPSSLRSDDAALAVLAGHPEHVILAEVVDVAAGDEQQVGKAVDVLQRRSR